VAVALDLGEWLAPIRGEYLETFIPAGGGALRFVVAEDGAIPDIGTRLRQAGLEAGLNVIEIDTATTRLHMLQLVFFAITERLDWDGLIQAQLKSLIGEAGYRLTDTADPIDLTALAEANGGIATALLRSTVQQHISRKVWEDAGLAQDFRLAIMALLDAALTGDPDGVRPCVIDWLRDRPQSLKWVKKLQIGTRIGRHNARAMLISLCHWLRQCGHPGLLLLLDARQMLRERREIATGYSYTPAAVMDCYEVLRQIIDDAEHFEGIFIAVVADLRLVNDDVPKRSLTQYTALKMRVWDDVRPQGRDNPLSPLVMLTR
jgi:hypothetical protein